VPRAWSRVLRVEGHLGELTPAGGPPPPPASQPRSRLARAFRFLLVGGGVFLLGFAVYVLAGLPSRSAVRALARTNPVQTALMRERQTQARKAKRAVGRSQAWVPLDRISRSLVDAVVVAEDPNFFSHKGIDWAALKEAAQADVRLRRYFAGGSTITQQLAKNLFFSSRKSVVRKIRELIVARWLEDTLGKRRILELYLNVIEWGDGVYGCEAGAQRYYGKSAAGLSETEAAGLAAMIPSPRRLNPRTNPVRHQEAQRRILFLMSHRGDLKRAVGGVGAVPPEEPVEKGEDDPPSEHSPSPEPSPQV
jgi:monofunctional biosynthetic peptidoglycan transglycosylase